MGACLQKHAQTVMSLRKEVITIQSVEYDGLSFCPKFIYSTKGVGSARINKFSLPDMEAVYDSWPDKVCHSFNGLIKQGCIVDIVFDKKYLIHKIDQIQLIGPSSFVNEHTRLINENLAESFTKLEVTEALVKKDRKSRLYETDKQLNPTMYVFISCIFFFHLLIVRSGFVKVGSLVLNSLDNDNSYEVFLRFHLKAKQDKNVLSCFISPFLEEGFEISDFDDADIWLQKRGSFTNLHEPTKLLVDLLKSKDNLENAVGFAVKDLRDKDKSPIATVYFRRWV